MCLNERMGRIFFDIGVEHSTEPEDLICYGFDASGLEEAPGAVVWPKDSGEASKTVRYAREKKLSVTPRGAGTGMTGGAVPSGGAIVLSTERMNRIVEVDEENLSVLVEPGVINGALQAELEKRGLFYPPDPASMNFCTLGGNVAENAGGPRAVKYGVTRDYVMGLEAVLPDGSVIETGVRTRKGVVGYDLTGLLVGSEGTLAVLTKIRLRCLPLPEEVLTLVALFADLEASGRAVSGITRAGIVPRTLEFMDSEAISAVEKFKPCGLPKGIEALLLIEFDGRKEAVRKEAEIAADVCLGIGASVQTASGEAERNRLWEARRAVSPALFHISPAKMGEDIVVPGSRIPEMLVALRRLSVESGIKIVNFGHAGDGNIHVNIMADRKNKEELLRAEALIGKIFEKVLELGGTLSGEHGVGLTKSAYIGMEIRKRELETMKGIKRLFDPEGILNPGKIFG